METGPMCFINASHWTVLMETLAVYSGNRNRQ